MQVTDKNIKKKGLIYDNYKMHIINGNKLNKKQDSHCIKITFREG